MATDVTGFLGLIGTDDWATNQRPENWRQTMLRIAPNGDTALTGLLSMLGTESTDDAKLHWWAKKTPPQGGDITNIYTDVGLSSAYASGGSDGDTLYVNVAESLADEVRVDHVVLLRDASDHDIDCVGVVTAVVKNGSSSYIAVRLLEDDDNSTSGYLANADKILVIGNVNSENGDVPDAISYKPDEYYNYTQIFRTPLELSRTAMNTRLRTGKQYAESKKEILMLHGMEMEKSFLWGVRKKYTGANGKPRRLTMGLIPFIKNNAPSDNVANYVTSSDYSGQTWLQGGKDFINEKLRCLFKYGSNRKLGICGSSALLALNDLAETWADINISVGQAEFGIKVSRWITPFGEIALINHPLFSYEDSNSRCCAIFEPALLDYVHLDNSDTQYLKNRQGNGVDGIIDEYLTEAGLKYGIPEPTAYLSGLGSTNTA